MTIFPSQHPRAPVDILFSNPFARHRQAPSALGTTSDPGPPLLIAWAPYSPRLEEMASELNGRLVFLNIMFGKKWAAPIRYILLALKTFVLLGRERPAAVVAQNPPIFCPLVVAAACRILKFKLIVDHHAVWSLKSIRQPVLSQSIRILERLVAKSADANTTANERWTMLFQEFGGRRVFTFHDFVSRPPVMDASGKSVFNVQLPSHRFLVLAPHGGHPDEMLEDEVSAMEGLDGYLLLITGRSDKVGRRLARLGPKRNVVYAGYLNQSDYAAIKRTADVGLSLSKEKNTVPHVLYEFFSNGTPVVVLKDNLLRSIFDGAIVEVEDAHSDSVRASLRKVCEDSGFRAGVVKSIDNNYDLRLIVHKDEISKLRELMQRTSR